MVIIGAKGFAKEILEIIYCDSHRTICFFDNISPDMPDHLYGEFPVLKDFEMLKNHFLSVSPDFVLGIGGTAKRHELYKKIVLLGGKEKTVIAKSAQVGHFGTTVGRGCCILNGSIITNDVFMDTGVIINKHVSVSHDVCIGMFSEISPGARILGRVKVGNFTSIGSNAVVLPDIVIGSHCKVGAGAVVTKDVEDCTTVAGVPAQILQ
jgi:sugar O-acyltransferase (sialic acid O-acetyltransferase NeuD family)